MFCPKCGKPEQKENSYCRQCGTFLPDFDQNKNKEISPEQHFTANFALNIMTGVASLGLAITLYIMFLGRDDTPFVIYLTAGFLTAMFFWQAQIFWRTRLLKKQFPKRRTDEQEMIPNNQIESVETNKLLNEPDLNQVVPISVIENTTQDLVKSRLKSSKSQQ
jgi:hypothetical protein